jgi:cytochrome c oxidase subunit II
LAATVLLLAGCDGVQSALAPAGRSAEVLAELWWWMAGGALVVWVVVVGLAVYAIRVRPGRHPTRTATILIIGGGTVFPTVVLAALLGYGLSLMPELLAPPPDGAPAIEISGEQWWWRVRYPAPGERGAAAGDVAAPGARGGFELANEIRLPVGERVELRLTSPDVVHSFWIPSLGGKMDMIPGRTTRLALEPTRTGTFRGTCAEYCGASHALMSLYAVVVERAEYEAWLARQGAPAAAPAGARARRGAELFRVHGCGACHAVRGTGADGTLGPDLTHVGSRVSLAAGILPNEPDAFRRWTAHSQAIKPEAHMPRFSMLPEDHLHALAAYLDGLE